MLWLMRARAARLAVLLSLALVVQLLSVADAKVLVGTESNDTILGSSKNDTISGEEGGDRLLGGPGNDTLFGGTDNDHLYLGPGRDRAVGGSGQDNIYDDDGDSDRIESGSGDDLIFSADGGKDAIDCGTGNFDIAHVDPADEVTGCEIVVDSGPLIGTNKSDELFAGNTVQFAMGKRGKDTLNSSSDGDVLLGGPDKDRFFGNTGFDDVIDDDGISKGRRGGDVISTGPSSDFVVSFDGEADRIDCGTGSDTAIVDRKLDKVVNCEEVIDSNA